MTICIVYDNIRVTNDTKQIANVNKVANVRIMEKYVSKRLG